jgi:hypothetical protein
MLNPMKWGIPEVRPKYFLIMLGLFIITEWFGRKGQFGLEQIGFTWKRPVRLGFYIILVILVYENFLPSLQGTPESFIYFQF